MAWNLVFSDSASRVDSAPGGVGNGWLDVMSVWSVQDNRIRSAGTNTSAYGDNPAPALLRPAAETPGSDVRVTCRVVADSSLNVGLVAHKVSGAVPTYLLCTPDFKDGNFYVYSIINGVPALVASNASSFVPADGSNCTVDFAISGTTVTATLTNNDTSTVIATVSGTVPAALRAAGQVGLVSWNGTTYAGNLGSYDDFAAYQQAAAPPPVDPTDATVTGPSSLTSGFAATYSVALNAAATASLTFTPSASGFTANFSPATVTLPQGATSGTFQVTPSSTGSGSIGGSAPGINVSSATGVTVGSAGTPQAASVLLSPSTFPGGTATPFTLTGTGTSWSADTRATLSGASGVTSGVTGMTCAGQVIRGYLNPGTATGTITVGTTGGDGLTSSALASLIVVGKVTFDGDSLTSGQYTTGEGTINATKVAATMRALGPTYVGQNIGVGGQTLGNMQSRIASQIVPFYDPTKQNYLVVQGGHNDIAVNAGGQPNTLAGANVVAAQLRIAISNYIAAVLSACPQMQVVWSTMLPAQHPVYPGYFNYVREEVNQWMRLSWRSLGIKALSDIALNPTIGVAGSEQNAAYFNGPDKTHPNDAGAQVWGTQDARTLTDLIAGGTVGTGAAGLRIGPLVISPTGQVLAVL